MLWGGVYAQILEFNGFVDTYHAMRISDEHDFLSSRSRLRGELKGEKGKSDFFSSMNASYNYILPSESGIELREAWLRYTTKNLDLKLGRQIFSWGQADGIKITDLISPVDMTEFLARDYDDIRMPVDAMRLRYMNKNMSAELVFVPVFQSSILPVQQNNPWSFIDNENAEVFTEVTSPDEPEKIIINSELGGKVSFNLSGIDFACSGLYTWNKTPVFSSNFSPHFDTIYLTPEHHRLGMCGLEFSRPQGKFVIRGEGAFLIGKRFSPVAENYSLGLIEKNSLNMLVGIDWYAGNEWMVSAQFSDEIIIDYEETVANNEHTILATLSVSKKLFRSKLALSSFVYTTFSPEAGKISLFDRTSLDYSLSDQLHLMAGVDFFYGDEGMFATYSNNSEVWIKAKYIF